MVTIEQQIWVALGHPLTLLLVGAGLTGALIPWFTKRSEDRRKELEIKADIISKMAEVIAYQMAAAFAAFNTKKKTASNEEKGAYYEDLKKWYIEVSIVNSKLESYFPDIGVKKKWDGFCTELLLSYSSASRQFFHEDPSELGHNLKEIRKYFPDNKEIEWDDLLKKMTYEENQWYKVGDLIDRRGEELIKEVLSLPIKVF